MSVTIIAFLLAFQAYSAFAGHTLDSCPVKVEPLGCYTDKDEDRVMNTEILNARDNTRHMYAGYDINWRKWTTYLPKFICHCAKLARAKGYRVMGIQFYGECWGSNSGHLKFAKHGKANACVHGERAKKWGKCKAGDVACSGEVLTNFVYRIAPTVCDTYYEPIGCYKDSQKKPRPFSDYILTERDYSHKNWEGHLINWKQWNTYSPEMICRCAKKAKDLKHTTFAIQYYGECWSGDESKIDYAKDGAGLKCLAHDFKPCPYNSYHCVGMAFANRVYKIKDVPPAAKPWKHPVKGTPLILT